MYLKLLANTFTDLIFIKMNKAYVSYSMQYANLVPEVEIFLDSLGYEPNHWKMGTKYESSLLTGSDIAVFIINDFNWGIKVEDMTRGTEKELETCIKKNIPVYIAYKRKTDKVLSIYKSEYDKKTLVGIGGTALTPYNELKYNPLEVSEKEVTTKTKRRHK